VSGLKTTTAIVEAISARRLLVLDYHGKTRTVEPHTFGLDSLGPCTAVRLPGRMRKPVEKRAGWRFFFIEQMSNVRLDARRFLTPRPEFVRGDGAFKSITAEV
jgi:hypothetical protein